MDGYPDTVGGAHVVARDLARSGQATGAFSVTVVLPAVGAASRWLEGQGVQVQVVAAPRSLTRVAGSWRARLLPLVWQLPRFWWALAQALRTADLVHLNDHRGLVLAGPAALVSRRPVAWHLHNTVTAGRAGRVLDPLGHRLARVLIVPSTAAGDGRPQTKTWLLPNTVSSSPLPRRPESGLLLAVGRLHPEKGFDLLLSAMAELQQRGHLCQLLIAGAEAAGHQAHAASLARTAAELGNVELLGQVDDLQPLLARAAIAVQPSRTESFGLAALEASAAGVAVVAADVGGLPGVVLHGQTGLLHEAGNPTALADALEQLLVDPERAARYGAAGADLARQDYSAGAFASRITDIYTAALA